MASAPYEAPDQVERDAAITERARNVVLDAGAGTGKTTILVERVVRMVAPPDNSTERAIPIGRIAAVTFTRRAAGELRLRIRERLLRELADSRTSAARQILLREALAGLDTAYVGTIHSFADRLLRLRPVEARLSPSYEIAEDNDHLVRETFDILLHTAQTGTLLGELRGTDAETLASEAERTIVDALLADLRRDSQELEFYTRFGLDALVREFIDHRDVPPVLPDIRVFNQDAFTSAVRELVALVDPIGGDSIGARWLRGTASLLEQLLHENDPVEILRTTRKSLRRPHDDKKGTGFGGDEGAWRAWKLFDSGSYKKEVRQRPLRDDIKDPLRAWLAPRLVRLFPVVTALYGKVKERHRAVDQIDLLLELRQLLRDDKESRAYYQSLFDHVLIDEFQDTDPLQAEIVIFLCENGAHAGSWREARLAPGKLTIVGDPKQSIYRFRRADIGMYDEVRQLVTTQEHLAARLSANFRSLEPLIGFFNDRFEKLLGKAPDEATAFNAATGEVFHRGLLAGRSQSTSAPCVEILPFAFPAGSNTKTDDYRDLEGEVLALYLRRLVESSGREIKDPVTGEMRALRYGDVAVLTLSTFTLPRLFKSLDCLSIPYAARGGRLFLEDELQRRFILGLRAIANRDDGPARAALLRPPFFAVDPLDLARLRAHRDAAPAEPPPDDEGARRAHEAEELVRELRRRRFDRTPGETARALLGRSALARTVALEPNGEQRLHHLREICLVLETISATEHIDFDAATARLRTWVAAPVQLDPPHPIGGDAVHMLTVHQAKGLEFPVVVLWDSCAQLRGPNEVVAWRTAHNGREWSIALDDFTWEEPRGAGIKEIEKKYRDAERKRLVYVAATRARDLLVLPRAAMVKGHHASFVLTDQPPPGSAVELEGYVQGLGAAWSAGTEVTLPPSLGGVTELDQEMTRRWRDAASDAAQPRFQPLGVTGLALDEGSMVAATTAMYADSDTAREDSLALPRKPREGRFGALFGETVHLAIARAVREPARPVEEIVREATASTGLIEHLDEAAADVKRAIAALRAASLLDDGVVWRFEYPLAGQRDGRLLVGYVDFLAVDNAGVHVVDFKTDAAPSGVADVPPKYAQQVEVYAGLLRDAGLADGLPIRNGLLFTAADAVLWLGQKGSA